MANRKKPSDRDPFLMAFGIYGAVGFQLALMVIGGLYLGNLADEHFGSTPWLTLIGILIGSTGGFYNLIRIVNWKQGRNS